MFRTWLLCSIALAWSSASMAQQFDVLLYTKANGYRHQSIEAGVAAIQKLGKQHRFDVFWTDDPSVFNDEALARFEVIVFLLTSGDVLNEAQKAAMERFIRSGRGFVGIHSAADTEYGWDWYTRMMGHMFVSHPAVQTATLQVEDANFPGMDRLPPRFSFTDEWYEFDEARSPNLKYLLTIDTSTYEPTPERRNEGSRHSPMSWYHEYDGGRAFYTTLGHVAENYSDERFQHHLYGGIYWAATGRR
jgi:Uncharacterized protein conserved in bacteria